MDNLKILKIQHFPLQHVNGPIIHLDSNSETDQTEAYFIRNNVFLCVNVKTTKETVFTTELSDVIHAEYMWTKHKVAVSSSDNIIIADCKSKDVYKYGFDKEVVQIAWNRVYDYLVVLFQDGSLQSFLYDLLKCELVSLGEGNLLDSVPERENVGWGSEDTQYQYPIKPVEVEPKGPHMRPPHDPVSILTWKPNGDEFILNFVGRNLVRQFKVFNRLCKPLAKSDNSLSGMYGPIAWGPEGNIIVAAMYKDDKNCIGLFEKNGLFRRMFQLVDIYYPIKLLSWSSCGRVLNVVQKDDQGNSHVCLYVTSNGKWYLKQHLHFQNYNPLNLLCWATTSPQCVELIAGTKREVIRYKYKFEYDFDHQNNLVAAIDGKTIRIHGLEESIDPCPFSSDVLVLDNPINMLAFHPKKDLAAAIDSSNTLYGFTIIGTELKVSYQSFLSKVHFPLNINHLFLIETAPHFILDETTEFCSSLYEFDTNEKIINQKFKFEEISHPIEHINSLDNLIIAHNETSRIVYKEDGNKHETALVYYPIKVIPMKYSGEIYCLTVTSDQELIIENEYMCKDVTSVIVHKEFLSITTNNNLYTIHLNKHSLETLAEDGLEEFFSRSLHEVASLVCMVGDSPKILLQTPRGNLEVISCRPMEILLLENKLSNSGWDEAIEFMRLARLNWNLLIDLNPDRFYENLPDIVAACNSQHVLNAIVGQINNGNCLMTDYRNALKIIPYTSLNKRNEFLEHLSTYLNQTGVFANYLPTVMKICVDQGNIEKAMTYVSFLLNENNKSNKAEEAITLLRIHVSADDLFNSALKVFDLQLADLVAKKCQINPQEINPLLEKLENMDMLQRRLTIHLKFENWEEAIAYMLRQSDVNKEETLEFIEKNKIEKRAYMECLQLKVSFKEEIAQLYIKKLISQKCHHEAAIIAVQLNFYDQAVEQFKLDVNHSKVLEYLPLSSLADDDKNKLLRDLAEKLVTVGKVLEAASVYEIYLSDYETAVKVLAEAGEFMDALIIARKYNLDNIIDVSILPKMLETLQNLAETIDTCHKNFSDFLLRLKKLRYMKKYNYEQLRKRALYGSSSKATFSVCSQQLFRPFQLSDNENCFFKPDCDVDSVISTGSEDPPFFMDSDSESVITVRSRRSSSSSSSTMTTKQIRKMEKLRQDTTEGSRFEDIAIMRELHLIISKIFQLGPDLRELILRLMEYSMMDLCAVKLHHIELYSLQKIMKDEVGFIWDPNFKEDSEMSYISENFLFMDEKFRVVPPEMKNPGFSWVLDLFKE